jgi:hypothetical protein
VNVPNCCHLGNRRPPRPASCDGAMPIELRLPLKQSSTLSRDANDRKQVSGSPGGVLPSTWSDILSRSKRSTARLPKEDNHPNCSRNQDPSSGVSKAKKNLSGNFILQDSSESLYELHNRHLQDPTGQPENRDRQQIIENEA